MLIYLSQNKRLPQALFLDSLVLDCTILFLFQQCAFPHAPALPIPNIGNGLVAVGILKRWNL